MAKACEICGRKADFGNSVSHSGRRSRRVRSANLHKVRVIYKGKKRTMWVCTRCLKAGKVQRV